MVENKVALVTGVSGQDGSILVDLLLSKGYEVHGIERRHAIQSLGNLSRDSWERIVMHQADLLDASSLEDVVSTVEPDEVYNLAAQSFVGVSYSQPWYTMEATGLGAMRVMEAARLACPDARIYQASSSEIFGNQLASPNDVPLNESSPFCPVSPYAVAKLTAHHAAHYYREAHGMFVSCGILFNHESERRGEEFVTRKISKAVARFATGNLDPLKLGNMNARRDWGYAPEYVEGMWRMLQQDGPDDFVLATGETHSVQEFLDEAWRVAGLEPEHQKDVVFVEEKEMRPSDIPVLIGDPRKAERCLGWRAETKFGALVRKMVEYDIKEAKHLA